MHCMYCTTVCYVCIHMRELIYFTLKIGFRDIRTCIDLYAGTIEPLYCLFQLWNTCHKPDLVRTSLKKSMEDLGLQYLDLYLIHWPIGLQVRLLVCSFDINEKKEAWKINCLKGSFYVMGWIIQEGGQESSLSSMQSPILLGE